MFLCTNKLKKTLRRIEHHSHSGELRLKVIEYLLYKTTIIICQVHDRPTLDYDNQTALLETKFQYIDDYSEHVNFDS
jgi:hypothetical protein